MAGRLRKAGPRGLLAPGGQPRPIETAPESNTEAPAPGDPKRGPSGDNRGDNTYVTRTHTDAHSPEGGGRASGEKPLKGNDFQPPDESATHTVMYPPSDS